MKLVLKVMQRELAYITEEKQTRREDDEQTRKKDIQLVHGTCCGSEERKVHVVILMNTLFCTGCYFNGLFESGIDRQDVRLSSLLGSLLKGGWLGDCSDGSRRNVTSILEHQEEPLQKIVLMDTKISAHCRITKIQNVVQIIGMIT